jgi:hypothetical protein
LFDFESEAGQIVDDRLLEFLGLPADRGVVRTWVDIVAAVVDVFSDAAAI